MSDVFEDWKSKKFVVVDSTLVDTANILILLTDISFWTKHEDELAVWCNEYDAKQQGMTVELDNENQLLMFCLKWS